MGLLINQYRSDNFKNFLNVVYVALENVRKKKVFLFTEFWKSKNSPCLFWALYMRPDLYNRKITRKTELAVELEIGKIR